jgi:hypothetical protein
MSDRKLSELANGEIVPEMGGPNAWLVRFGEGDYDTVNKSGKNTLLLKGDVASNGSESYGGIEVNFDLDSDDITISDGSDSVRVPSIKQEDTLQAVFDGDGERLQETFDEVHVPTVRQGLMDMLMPRFRDEGSRIRKTDGGWLLNDDIMVNWDATNSPANIRDTHVVSGGSTVIAEDDKEAREISFDIADEKTIDLPNGTETELTDVEAEFLTSVGLILGQDEPGGYVDCISNAISASEIVGFTDTKSGLHHSHGLNKHTLQEIGVTDEAAQRLWYNDYDHTGVHEMYIRRDEFENAPIDVFTDAPNRSAKKWRQMKKTSQQAPIPKQVRSDLQSRYE